MNNLNKLSSALKTRYPGVEVNSLAALLSLASKNGRIYYEEIDCDKEAKEDILLLAYNQRLLIPTRMLSKYSASLAWEDSILTLQAGEVYEMPNVIQNLVAHAEETGEWRPEYAIKKYLEDIREREAENILKLFCKIRSEISSSKTSFAVKKITPQLLRDISQKLQLKTSIDKIIVELKAGGVISPCLRNFSRDGILYEVNPSLL
ncbi:MAG: hypothetical protein ACUVXA_19950 [Candidatus Jordarchaeum sp.]|uniref:hypothetical protein n=1 Tax=Candidatus Jordarchaeum sp. TaxID=2823881 RepID=UPI00404B0F06